MHYRDVSRALGFYLWILLLPLLIPTSIAIYTDWIAGPDLFPQPSSAWAFLVTMGITAFLGLLFWLFGSRGHHRSLYRREGLLLVLVVYFLTPAVGALPFWLNGTLKSPLDAYFEAVSGFTTTGASILEAKKYNPISATEEPINVSFCVESEVEYNYLGTVTPVILKSGTLTGLDAVSRSLIFWRSFMQCLGGGGIVVLFVAILPALGVGGKILYQTEVTGPARESIFPRVKETASMLWKVYLGLILLETLLLYITNQRVSLWDALNVSMTTLATGGFCPRNGGITYYDSLTTNWIIFIFMILGSINFSLYFLCMRGKFSKLNDPELKAFLGIIFVAVVLAVWKLTGVAVDQMSGIEGDRFSFWQALSFGAFQVVSAQTSTGFFVSNYDVWPFSMQVLMLILFFVGGMAGSTAGGIKIIREQTFVRIMFNKIESIFRPDTVRDFRIGNHIINESLATTVLCFLMVVSSLTILSTYFFVLDGIDPETSISTVGCMINNVGIAFRAASPEHSFAFLPPFSKVWSIFLMIAGRLEFFALLIAFMPAFWRRG